jgi:hypothetical protein
MTYLEKDTQHSKAIRVTSRLATAAVLVAVPVHQVKLQLEAHQSLTEVTTKYSALF